MHELSPYFGDLHAVLPAHWCGVVLVLSSVLCGLIIGAEREVKQKPAGLRTLMLICVGSTIFTLASILIAGDTADRTRITAQVVTGVGFLGAGAILQHRGTVVGLTTGAAIWTAAAIGVLIGGGYAAAGVVLTLVVVGVLLVVQRLEHGVIGRCRYARCRVVYAPDHGKTRIRLIRLLDEFRVPGHAWEVSVEGEHEVLQLRYCYRHAEHRALLADIAHLPAVHEVHDANPAANPRPPGDGV